LTELLGMAGGLIKRLLSGQRPSANVEGAVTNSVVAGSARDIYNYNAPAPAAVGDEWEDEPGAPVFRISPGSNGNQGGLIQHMMFRQVDGGAVGGLAARWRGGGIADDYVRPMRENGRNAYQLKSVTFAADAEPDSELGPGKVGLELRFKWAGAERHVLWVADLEQNATKGHWNSNWQRDPERYWTEGNKVGVMWVFGDDDR